MAHPEREKERKRERKKDIEKETKKKGVEEERVSSMNYNDHLVLIFFGAIRKSESKIEHEQNRA